MSKKSLLEVTSDKWVSTHQEFFEKSFSRFEFLTASHIGNDLFEVFSKISLKNLSESVLLKTQISVTIHSVAHVYEVAYFHECELSQMFGIKVIGTQILKPAFDIIFDGYPLRRDFALVPRQEKAWPGFVEPDEKSRRKPTLSPGVFETWIKNATQ